MNAPLRGCLPWYAEVWLSLRWWLVCRRRGHDGRIGADCRRCGAVVVGSLLRGGPAREGDMAMKRLGYLALGGYVGSVVAANWLITAFGIVPVPLTPWVAPAGFYAVGLSLSLRDLVHERLGRRWVVGGILAGAALSAWLSPSLALASGAAFLVSEAADMLVYGPLRRRSRVAALVASNSVGALVDSALFLALAGLPLALVPGQTIGKIEMVLPALVAMWLWRAWRGLPVEVPA